MRIWRRTEKISWTEHISNEMLKLVEEEKSLLTIIRTRQRNWMRRIMRGDSLQIEIIKGRMEGKRGRGRPRKTLVDWMRREEYSKLKEAQGPSIKYVTRGGEGSRRCDSL